MGQKEFCYVIDHPVLQHKLCRLRDKTTTTKSFRIPMAIDVPLETDSNGVIRVTNTRVTLSTLIAFYNVGQTPQQLHEAFPTVSLTAIFTIIAYYLSNRDTVDDYINQIELEAEALRRKIEASYTPEQQARTEYFRKLADEKHKSS